MASRVYRPFLRAFLLPRGAPDPAAPPCIRQRRFPATAGDMQGFPERVLAPHRKLESIALVLRRCLPLSFLFNFFFCAAKWREHALGYRLSASALAEHR
jgi:hypothetical protein